jgi:hypothetical protein
MYICAVPATNTCCAACIISGEILAVIVTLKQVRAANIRIAIIAQIKRTGNPADAVQQFSLAVKRFYRRNDNLDRSIGFFSSILRIMLP